MSVSPKLHNSKHKKPCIPSFHIMLNTYKQKLPRASMSTFPKTLVFVSHTKGEKTAALKIFLKP